MELAINGRSIGDGEPAFVIAEVGSNHNQNFTLAIDHIDAAAEAGVDAVKFQTFRADKHVSRYAEVPSYLEGYDNIHELIHSLELDREWQMPLQEHAEEKGLVFLSSPCDCEAVDGLDALGAPAFKVASFDLPDLDLVRYIAKKGKPVLMSTGLADWMEIQRAVDVCRAVGNDQIVLFQCTSIYPAPPHLSNLRAMATMRNSYNVITGYSDHTLGDAVALAAVSMGAAVIEKHFTLDRGLPGPDHPFAIEPGELKEMMVKIRDVEAALGDGVKNGPREEEREMYEKARRSLHAARDIAVGEVVSEDMLVVKRPGLGIEPFQKHLVIGRPARVAIKADQWIDWTMV